MASLTAREVSLAASCGLPQEEHASLKHMQRRQHNMVNASEMLNMALSHLLFFYCWWHGPQLWLCYQINYIKLTIKPFISFAAA